MNEPSAIPALAFGELDPVLADALRPRVERLGYLGGFFAVMGHQPETLVAFDAFTEACKRALPVDLLETIALSAATRLGNDYERQQHEQLSLRLGLDRAWVAAVERLSPDDAIGLNAEQRAVQRFVLEAVDTVGLSAAESLDVVVGMLGPTLATAVVLATARYLAHAMIANACRLPPPVPSIFDENSDGEDDDDGR